MNRTVIRTFAIVALLCAAGESTQLHAQISVQGGNLLMSVTTGTAGAQPVAVTNTAATLRIRRETVITKVTVSTSCPGQRFSLAVIATNLTSGVAAPQVNLVNGMPAADFILNLPTNGTLNKTCTLRYTASATFAQGNSTELGNDVHAITYTLVAQ